MLSLTGVLNSECQGYTSLGNPDNTRPNPALVTTNSAGEEMFGPAYTLQDPGLERQGRR